MIPQLKRKIGQVASDTVLRKWLIGRALLQLKGPAVFAPHQPPYIQHLLPLDIESPEWDISPPKLAKEPPKTPMALELLGISLVFDQKKPVAFLDSSSDDIEFELAQHRFTWIPLSANLDAAWLNALWRAWRGQFMNTSGWAWHPYTTAERAVNLLDAAGRCGIPDALDVFAEDLTTHAREIAQHLEYFGDHNTSNHLANNGRGLYRLGCALRMPHSRTLGYEILCHEAERIILEGGSLREGSTHYHMLYARNYIDVWLAAHRHGHNQEAEHLKGIAARLLAVAKNLVLPGGLPLIGDISPDCPPAFLAGIETGACAWTETLSHDEQLLIKTLAKETLPTTSEQLQSDGWVRADFGPWSILTSAPSTGWPFMPGHAHQDIGSAEIHFDGQPLFVDPGRGAYGETGEAVLYRSAAVHGGLSIDRQDPYPANKPYYNDVFRQTVAGPAWSEISADNVTVTHGGYRRLGIGSVQRTWTFEDNNLTITDSVKGRGQHVAERALVTPHDVKIKDDKVIINNLFIMHASDARPRITPVKIWEAYGRNRLGSRIVFENTVSSSWAGTIKIEAQR